MNEWKCSDLKCIQKSGVGSNTLTSTTVEQSRLKSLDGPRVRVISPVVKEKVYGGKDLLKSQVLSSEWNTERVREDASGDSEDDEMPCVIGESVPCTGIEKGRSEPQLGDDNFFTANAEIFNVMRIESRITVL